MGPPTDTGLLNCYLILPQVITSSKCHASWCHHHVHENVDMTTATSLLFQQIYKFSSLFTSCQARCLLSMVVCYHIWWLASHRWLCIEGPAAAGWSIVGRTVAAQSRAPSTLTLTSHHQKTTYWVTSGNVKEPAKIRFLRIRISCFKSTGFGFAARSQLVPLS